LKTIREQHRVPAMPALNSLEQSEPWWWGSSSSSRAGRNVKQNECQITAASSEGNEPPVDKSVDYRAFPLQTTTEEIIEIFAQLKKLFN
jgi:hypothetical protein